MIDESGLTFVQMKALVDLQNPEEEARTVTVLSEELGISAASASRAADGLVRRSWPPGSRIRATAASSAWR